jgi:hypothetical protein
VVWSGELNIGHVNIQFRFIAGERDEFQLFGTLEKANKDMLIRRIWCT